jgi:endonuclease G
VVLRHDRQIDQALPVASSIPRLTISSTISPSMSKFTLAAVAGASAAVGAATTAVFFGARRQEPAQAVTATSPTIAVPSKTAPLSPGPIAVGTIDPKAIAAIAPVDPSGLFQYGFPGPVSDLRTASSLTSSYNRTTRNPNWVAEHITPASVLMREGDRRHSVFVEDLSIPEKFRAKLKDYFRSGYDRGHQVPAADAKWSQDAMNATFALSNMCPQVGEGFNRDYWAHVEDFCRRLTTFYPSVRIVTGPLYLPKKEADGKWKVSYEVIGSPPNIAVPTHFYKIIYAEDGKAGGNVSLGAFVLPNDRISNDKPLKDFEVPVEAVERAAGLEFASLLPPTRRKQLCKEINCSVIVKEYAERQKAFVKPSPK